MTTVHESLHRDWQPEWGSVYTWFAMDKNGYLAQMINNSWGNIPSVVLKLSNINQLLDDLNEYTWEESKTYIDYLPNKNGELVVDLFSYFMNSKTTDKNKITASLVSDLENRKHYSTANIAVNKGIFVFEAVEGYKEGDDYPVGYEGNTHMGDYFRFLVPTKFGSINDFPTEIRHVVAVSDTLDFTKDRLIENTKINEYFTKTYESVG